MNDKSKLCLLILPLLCSCATIFNNRKAEVNIYVNQPVKFSIGIDTTTESSRFKRILVDRNKDPLYIQLKKDSTTKVIRLKSKNSIAYNNNWLLAYGIPGYLIYRNKSKRYTYPQLIFVDMLNKGNAYVEQKEVKEVADNFPRHFIKFSLLRIVDPVNPMVEFNYEYKQANSFSTQVSTGIINRFWNDSDYQNQKGYRLSLEERYYLNRSAPIGKYLALEYTRLKTDYNKSLFLEKDLDVEEKRYDSQYWDDVHLYKTSHNFNIKFGYQMVRNHFVLDGYLGFGLKIRSVKHEGRINPDDVLVSPRHPNVYYYGDREGKRLGVNFPLNFRIGYAF